MAKTSAVVFGIIFLILGILAFISNPLVGSVGLFGANMLLALAYLVTGVILLIVAYSAPARSALWLKIFGVIYLIMVVLGFVLVPGGGTLFGLFAMSAASNWLHLVLGIVLLVCGIAGKKGTASPMQSQMPPQAPPPAPMA